MTSNNIFFFFKGWAEGLRVAKGNGFLGAVSGRHAWDVMCSPCRAVCLWVGSGVTRLAWPRHPETGADLLSQRCVLPTDDRDWLYANTCRKGWIPIFGKWQDCLKVPAWFNRGDRVADQDMVPQAEKKPPRRLEMLCLTNPSLQQVNSTWKVLHNCRSFF